ncbi:hypothetical protein [Halorientalis marina]|jgi:hypothetical protein|uniref:hypothetical protein n=1 Tax=Halorientalis marina TaxID=2931976 RepID=UPI001FF6A748|nr:hypothetical protein [Halorientalis marina]
MVSVADIVGLLVILGVNSAVAALMTRFFRVRLKTRWGSVIYTVLLTPLVLLVLTLIFGGVLGLGPDLGGEMTLIGVTIVLPTTLGVAFDYFWMPSPDEVDVPQRQSTQRSRREL